MNSTNAIGTTFDSSTTNITLSSHLYDQFTAFTNGNVSIETKLETASNLENFLGDDDVYITFCGESHQAHLPALTNWNGTSGLRKGYTLLMWIRPRISFPDEVDNPHDDDEFANDSERKIREASEETKDEGQRVLYRFSTSTEDSAGSGICVVCSQWKAVPFEEDKSIVIRKDFAVEKDESSSEQRLREPPRRQLETMLTAYTLPRYKPHQLQSGGAASRTFYVQQPLILIENEWQLLGFSHSHPYLKTGVWSVSVNGRLLGSDDLPYPALPENHHVNSMEYCSLFNNVTSGGAILTKTPSEVEKPDSAKTASQLQAQSNHNLHPSSNSSRFHQNVDLLVDVSSIALYADKTIPLACLAVAADAGHALALQKNGRILPTLPPVANWTKGASLEGPKVGIPLAVHSSALNLQQLSSAPNLVFCCSAVSAKVLGSPEMHSTRLVCSMQLQPGSTANTPRVGLIQPAAPLRIPEEDLPCLYVVGNVRLYHAVSQFLLNSPEDVGEQISAAIEQTTKNLSVAFIEQEIFSSLIQPFFLALCPPGKIYNRHKSIYLASLKHLHNLYSRNGKYGAALIRLFTIGIKCGGGRVHEEILQSGLLHVLASSIRLSLLRASRLKLFQDPPSYSAADFVRRVQKVFPDETNVAPPQHGSGTCPPFIPSLITEAFCSLLDACCGPAQSFLENLSPHHQIRRTSDLALTAIFGVALDMDLWSGDVKAASKIFECIAQRYGGLCVTSGYIMRSQISVQHLLDVIRLHFGDTVYSEDEAAASELEMAAMSISKLLQSMLLSSLSNMRSITQGENDIAACMTAICERPLGTVGSHVVLSAIVGVLVWCDVLPIEATSSLQDSVSYQGVNDQDKMQVASRLGRNILVAQFHDVIAPMLLSRTVFSGDRIFVQLKNSSSQQIPIAGKTSEEAISWQTHWRLSLLLFSWVASIAGPEGIVATKSCGNLLFASSKAGSLEGALEQSNKAFISILFLPSPSISLLIGSSLRNEWSYTDLLSDRLEIMIPLLPGLVMALLSRLRSTMSGNHTPVDSIATLTEILTAVGGAFHRVFGGVIHSSSNSSTPYNSSIKRAESEAIKAAKTHAPHLAVVALLLENQILACRAAETDGGVLLIPYCRTFDEKSNIEHTIEPWLEVGSANNVAILNEITVAPSGDPTIHDQQMLLVYKSCEKCVVNITAGLLANAMNIGGTGASIPLWQTIVSCIQESSDVRAIDILHETSQDQNSTNSQESNNRSISTGNACSSHAALDIFWNDSSQVAICRLLSQVFEKALRKTRPRDIWGYELSSSIAGLLTWIEDSALLLKIDLTTSDYVRREQLMLVCMLVELLAYGRESAGWYEGLPPVVQTDDVGAASKLLLPLLRPSLRILLRCLGAIPSNFAVTTATEESPKELLVQKIIAELNLSLTAAIVGLAFSHARDTALFAMAILRNLIKRHEAAGEEECGKLCRGLVVTIAEELRVRYESERQLREMTLFDAYDSKQENAMEGSQAIEQLIVGGGLFQSPSQRSTTDGTGISEDFVLFHDPTRAEEDEKVYGKLGFEFLQGLANTLEVWKDAADRDQVSDKSSDLLSLLNSFLDAWDTATADDIHMNNAHNLLVVADSTTALQTKASDSAANAMSIFFEFAASEKNRLKEMETRFLPSYRYSRISFADRFCWAKYMESEVDMKDVWERGVPDGNRDVRSRIPTVPCFPQFRRYLPSYLDNSPMDFSISTGLDVTGVAIANLELEEFTKTLMETGNLEIMDITKKKSEDEDEPDIRLTSTSDVIDEEENLFTEADDRTEDDDHQEAHQDPNSKKTENASNSEVETASEEHQPLEDELAIFPSDLVGKGLHNITTSSFSTPPDNASSSLSLLHSAAAELIEMHVEYCVHVKAEGNRHCTVLITSSHLILEYDGNPDGFFDGEILALQEEADRLRMTTDVGATKEKDANEILQQKLDRRNRELAALRPKSIRWNLTEVSHIYLRRYRLRDTALEMFFIPTGSTSFGGYGVFSPSSSLYLDFGSGYEGITRRDEAAFAIMRRSPSQAIKQWPDRSEVFMHEQLNRLTLGWVEGRITNFDYLLHLNMLSGRSYNDICQYPVFPWVLSNYASDEIPDLTDRSNYRDLTKPIGALNPERLKDFLERFRTFSDPSIPPFLYGSHYSTSAGVVLHYLVRLHPFAGLHRQLQGGHFDVADRLFSSIPRTWSMCTGSSAAEVKELTPEWYCNPSFLRNVNNFKLGTSQDGEVIDTVVLPPWAKGSPETFVEVMRAALESDICSEMLSSWIDLIFGKKQQGPAAIEANNVFFYLTYYGTVDVASIEDESLRQATELQIAHFGQCPQQLFKRYVQLSGLGAGCSISPYLPHSVSLTSSTCSGTQDSMSEGYLKIVIIYLCTKF